MQEKLKVFSLEGVELMERNLSSETKPLMILAGDSPRIVDTVPQGSEVLGALVRDEDGWTLASAKSDVPVSSGPKSGADFHLTAGISCSLGPWLFRIEREGTATGTVLLWKVGASNVVADPLIAGRNVVSVSKDGSYAVNSAVPGEELCDIYLASDGIEVIPRGGDARRIVVSCATVFSSGPFQAMALPAAEAALAVKSGNPFSWPGRKTRSGVMASLLLCGLVCLAALSFVKMKSSVDDAVAQKGGAEEIARKLTDDTMTGFSNEDVLVYKFAFYRSLPLITGPERSPITRDLISRGKQLSGHIGGYYSKENEKSIAKIVSFLKSVDAIQAAIASGDWPGIKETLAKCDKEMFVKCDAEVFRSDAQKIADFVMVDLPKFMSSISELGVKDVDKLKTTATAKFDGLKDNMFMSGEVVSRERATYRERRDVLFAYVAARNRFLASEGAPDAELVGLWADFLVAFEAEDETFAKMVDRERRLLADAVEKRASKIEPVDLKNLCDLGASVGVDASKLSRWSSAADAARKVVLDKCRDMYSEYRMRSAQSRRAPETLALLDRIIAQGLEDSSYYKWAVRERERLNDTKGDEK